MNENELKQRFPQASSSFIAANTSDGKPVSESGVAKNNPLGTEGCDSSVPKRRKAANSKRSAELQDGKDGVCVEGQGDGEDYGSPADPAGTQEVDGAGHPSFRIAVTLRFADYRRKDPDGCLATLMDCLNGAVGRLLGVVPRHKRKERTVRPRRRGGSDRDNEDFVKNPPF